MDVADGVLCGAAQGDEMCAGTSGLGAHSACVSVVSACHPEVYVDHVGVLTSTKEPTFIFELFVSTRISHS